MLTTLGAEEGAPHRASSLFAPVLGPRPAPEEAHPEEVPPPGAELVETSSPVDAAGEIEAAVLAAHALDDPAVPVAELRLLEKALPERR